MCVPHLPSRPRISPPFSISRLPSKVGALKSREASSENVLRVAKETLDARKKQVQRKGSGSDWGLESGV